MAGYGGREEPYQVHLIAVGLAGPPALHAAFLEPGAWALVQLRDSLRAWADVVRAGGDVTMAQMMNAVHGVLRYYDLPDLARSLGQPVSMVD